MADIKDIPKVELTRAIIRFDEDCIDPTAQIVLNEALEYAIETALGRLGN